jgi:protein tyrosine phosphatase (PTP) superfamily phosphohydrolase (DUF442 family)
MSLIVCGCAGQRGFPPKDQIQNFDVVDAHLCRGAQPNAAGLEALAKSGVTLVLNLRRGDTWLDEWRVCNSLGMDYKEVGLSGVVSPKQSDLRRIVRMIDEHTGKVFVHCQFGCDRTGVVVACYRIGRGMSPEEAYKDARFHGFSPIFTGFRDVILNYKP